MSTSYSYITDWNTTVPWTKWILCTLNELLTHRWWTHLSPSSWVHDIHTLINLTTDRHSRIPSAKKIIFTVHTLLMDTLFTSATGCDQDEAEINLPSRRSFAVRYRAQWDNSILNDLSVGHEIVSQQALRDSITERQEAEWGVLADLHSVWNGVCDPEVLKLGCTVHKVFPWLLGEHRVGHICADLLCSLVYKCLDRQLENMFSSANIIHYCLNALPTVS